jgi:scyllo-inositol 2-dehydrogenase (NADP+)
LHGSVLVPNPGPRYVIHGTRGSYSKFGVDPQEEQLKAGLRPGNDGWGIDTRPGTIWRAGETGLVESAMQNEQGDYSRYYAALRDAVLLGTPNPVPADETLRVMALIELGRRSAATGQVMQLNHD